MSRDFEPTSRVLGTGYSGAVRLAEHRATKQQVAVKQFSKRRLKPHRVQLLQSEVEVYLHLDHPNVCRLLHAYEGKHDVWLVMELCGCELYSRLCERKAYSEQDAADVMLQMLKAVSYLHTHRIVHRDLKLENWMYGSGMDDRLKLIDFGFSRILGCADETLDMPCGTLHYTSPEVLSRKYTSKCDLWSLGVICYMLLIGRPPFRGVNDLKIAKSIIRDEFQRDERWAQVSLEGQDFISQLLQKDPNLRPDSATAIGHCWFKKEWCNNDVAVRNNNIDVSVLQSLQKFARGTHLRRAALTMMAFSLTSTELQDLEQTFLAFDTSGTGTISLNDLAAVMHQHLEVSSQEVERIFESLDFAQGDEVHYTSFIAAMLATRVRFHEDKVRAAFDAFDQNGSGFITANSLVQIFAGLSGAGQAGKLSLEEAEQWIREVDYKGNGVIDYDGFLAALMGRKLGAPTLFDSLTEHPTVRVYEDGVALPRGRSDTDLTELEGTSSSKVRHGIASMIIDRDLQDRRTQTFTTGFKNASVGTVQMRTINCEIDENHFT